MKTIMQAIEQYRMTAPGDLVVIGLSGGADSVALTHFLQQYGVQVIAVHLNHMLRGEESLRDEAFVQQFCAQLGIPCIIKRVDVAERAAQSGQSVEAAGRVCRYDFFAEQAKKYHAKIATAHTLSDQMETMLFRLSRGCGLKGLCGIPPMRYTQDGLCIIRPLICTSREQVEAYCAEHQLKFVTDSSNLTDAYARNLIRHQAIPVLRRVNSAVETHFGQTAQQLAREESFMEEKACEAYAGCQSGKGLSAAHLLALHPALQPRVIRMYLKRQGIEPDVWMTERFLKLAQKELLEQKQDRYGEMSLPGGMTCFLRGGSLFLSVSSTSSEHKAFPVLSKNQLHLNEPVSYQMPSGRTWTFLKTDTKAFQKIHKNIYFFLLDYDKIKGSINCRCRHPGDRMTIAGRGVTKTVKKWMNEEEIPIFERNQRFVLEDEDGVIAVEGMGFSERVSICSESQTFLFIWTSKTNNRGIGETRDGYDG